MAGHALEEVEASLLVQDRVGRPEEQKTCQNTGLFHLIKNYRGIRQDYDAIFQDKTTAIMVR